MFFIYVPNQKKEAEKQMSVTNKGTKTLQEKSVLKV